MGQKALIRLLIVFAALGAVALVFKLAGPGKLDTITGSTDRENLLPDFPINEVARVRVRDGSAEVNLARSGDRWTVAERDEFPAKTPAVVEFLRSVWDLKIVQSPEIGESQYHRLSLVDPAKASGSEAATVVTFLNAEGQELRSLWLGKTVERSSGQPSPFGGLSTVDAGRYARVGGESAVYLVTETFKEISTDPAEWLGEDFFQISQVQAIAIETGEEGEDWQLTREEETGDFTLAEAADTEELDPVKVGSMKNAFSSPRFEDLIVGDEATEKAPGQTTFHIDTFEGFRYTVKLGEKTDLNEYYLSFEVSGEFPEARVPGEEESDEEKERLDEQFAAALQARRDKLAAEQALAGKVFKVRSYVADSLIKKRSEILKTVEDEPEPAEPEIAPGLPALPGLPGLTPEAAPAPPADPSEPATSEPAPAPAEPAPAPAEPAPPPSAEPAPAPAEPAPPSAEPAPEPAEPAAPPEPSPEAAGAAN